MALHYLDNFNRADSSSVLGSTNFGGAAWVAHQGTWGISTNRAYCSADSGGFNFATIPTGLTDCVLTALVGGVTSGGEQVGIWFRQVDANNAYVLESGNGSTPALLWRRDGGTFTTIATSGSNVQFTSGSTVTVELSGSSIVCKLNSTTIISHTDSTHMGTSHGMYVVGASAAMFDTFSVSDVQLLLADTFNRADNTITPDPPDLGGPYVERQGALGISSNRFYSTTSVANAHVTFPAAVDVDLQVTNAVNSGNETSLIWRWVDVNNFWYLNINASSSYSLRRMVAASPVVYHTLAGVPANNDVLRVIAKGTYIYIWINGVLRATGEDQFVSVATATCGLRIGSSTAARFDDLTASSAPATIPGGVDGATAEIDYDVFAGEIWTPDQWVYKGRNTKADDTGANA